MIGDSIITKPTSTSSSDTSVMTNTSNSNFDNLPEMKTNEPPSGKTQENINSDNANMVDGQETPIDEKDALKSGTESIRTQGEPEDEIIYPTKFKLILIVVALNLSIFCVGLDNTIISSAIPRITDQFNSLADVGWYGSSYLLTSCASQLSWGKLYTFYSIKWVYITALFIFEVGSLICAAAPTSTALIIGRAIAGLGSGGVGSGAFLLVAHTVPSRQRSILIGLIGGMYGFASIAGPLMGGAFTNNSKLTWRWCFYINLPLGLINGLFILFVKSTRGKKTTTTSFVDQIKQMDLPGTTCLLPGVICLLLALQWGGTKYEWKSGRIIALLVLACVLLIGFVVIQVCMGDRATVPLRVMGNRNIWGSCIFAGCVLACFFVMLYYIPIWFQVIKGVSPVMSGIMNLPMVLSFVIFSFLGGTLTSVIGYYIPFIYLTVILMAIGTGLLTTLTVDSGSPQWIGYQFIFGAGAGLGLQSSLIAAQIALPIQDVPIGTAIILFSENFMGAVMVSVAQNVFTNQLTKNLITYVPTIDPSIILTVGATQIKSQVPQELYGAVLIAYNKALTQTFYLGVALSCLAIFGVVCLQWLSVKGKKKDIET